MTCTVVTLKVAQELQSNFPKFNTVKSLELQCKCTEITLQIPVKWPWISWISYLVIGMNFFFNWNSEAETSNLVASHLTSLRGTSVLTKLSRHSIPYLWITSLYLVDKPSTTPEKNFPEYLVKVEQTGKSLDLFCLYMKQKGKQIKN